MATRSCASWAQLVFAERTGRGTPDSQAKIEELISAISAHERENGLNLASPADRAAAWCSGRSIESIARPRRVAVPARGWRLGRGTPFPPPGGGQDAGSRSRHPARSFFPPPGDGEPGGTSGYPPNS